MTLSEVIGFQEASIDEMEPGDLDEVLSVEGAGSLVAWTRPLFLEEMGNPLSRCHVLRLRGKKGMRVIGFICFRLVAGESEVLNLGVHPDFRNCGCGRRLMTFYLGHCREAGVKKVFLEVNPDNEPALRLYRSLAFRSAGLRRRFYQGRFDALILERDLLQDQI
jgi:[ribosomal protein S18]-alanine N-acetyltransferase